MNVADTSEPDYVHEAKYIAPPDITEFWTQTEEEQDCTLTSM